MAPRGGHPYFWPLPRCSCFAWKAVVGGAFGSAVAPRARKAGRPRRDLPKRLSWSQGRCEVQGIGMSPVWDETPDEGLLATARAEPAAFGAFDRRHEDRVLSYFLGHVGDPEVAADLTAETFAAALASAHRFRPRKSPASAWLFGIARNKLAMSRRRGRVEARARRRLGMAPLVLTDESIERITALDRTALALVQRASGRPAGRSEGPCHRRTRLPRHRDGPALFGGGRAQAREPRARNATSAHGGRSDADSRARAGTRRGCGATSEPAATG